MLPNLNRLVVFHAVAESGSFTRAAERLCLTQGGVSKHVGQLEDYFRTRLFDRLGKRVSLTEPGRVLHEATRELVRLIEDAEARVTEVDGPAGALDIAASITAGTYILPPILARYRAQHERVEIRVDVVLGDQVVEKVLGNSADLGLVGHAVQNDRLMVQPFLSDELVMIVPARHRWASRRGLPLATLAEEVFLLPRQGSGTRRLIEQALTRRDVVPGRVMEYGNTDAVIKAVGAGLGVALVSRRAAMMEVDAAHVAAIRLSDATVRRDFSVIWRKGKYLTKAARAFIEALAALR